MNQLQRLAKFSSELNLYDIPKEVPGSARYCVLDTVGSALGAAGDIEICSVIESLGKWTGSGIVGCSSVWGQKRRFNPFAAVLANGLMGHALELDDVHAESKSHVGAVVVITAWTLADALGISGRSFLEAVIAGYEVMARIGMGMNVASNRKRGWHTTGIIGTFGAAAAAARLLKLNETQTLSAFGIAGSQSAGLWAFLAEGATCKKLSPARAAVNGLTSAILAQSGMTGPEHILDAEDGGLYQAVSDDWDLSALNKDLGKTYAITQIDKKPYPCCRTTHHAIDAALKIDSEREFNPDLIEKVVVETYEVGVLQCGSANYPQSIVEAKFSIAFTMAAAFVNKKITQSEFCHEVLKNPLVRRIAERTTVVADPLFSERYPKRWGCRATVTMRNGSTKICQIDDMSGSVNMPLTHKQEQDKFLGLAQVAFPFEKALKSMESILQIDNLERVADLA